MKNKFVIEINDMGEKQKNCMFVDEVIRDGVILW